MVGSTATGRCQVPSNASTKDKDERFVPIHPKVVELLNRLNIQEAVEVCLDSFPTATRGKERARRIALTPALKLIRSMTAWPLI